MKIILLEDVLQNYKTIFTFLFRKEDNTKTLGYAASFRQFIL
jgi:hypothetical protein